MKSFVKGPVDGYMGIVVPRQMGDVGSAAWCRSGHGMPLVVDHQVLVNLTFMMVMTQWMGLLA